LVMIYLHWNYRLKSNERQPVALLAPV
jgi:hypothetical protein